MTTGHSLLTVGTFVSAFIGAVVGVFVDRVWRRVESTPLFEISLGKFWARGVGEGRTVHITNVGTEPFPEYRIVLVHDSRGTMNPFEPEGDLVFPQYPHQTNSFRVVTVPAEGRPGPPLQKWFETDRDGQQLAPDLLQFSLQVVLRNSERVLLNDRGLGNTLAKMLYEDAVSRKVEQPIKEVSFRSQAPLCVRLCKRWQDYRLLRRLKKQPDAEPCSRHEKNDGGPDERH